jgi:hypothetical protein
MNPKTTVLMCLVGVFVLVLSAPSMGVIDTRAIDKVRGKTVLTDADLQVIDAFVADAVKEILRTRDFTTAANTRGIILSRTSKQGQYAQQFSESAHKYIAAAMQEAATLPADRSYKVHVNFMVLIDRLKDLSLVDWAFNAVGSDSAPVRYWAMRVMTSDVVIDSIKRGTNATVTNRILDTLTKSYKQCSPDALALIATLGAAIESSAGMDLLLDIVNHRIAKYADWSVTEEDTDTRLLKFLCQEIMKNNADKERMARAFAQLYSHVIQRYAKGANRLHPLQSKQLISVIAETEDKCIGTLMGMPQNNLRRALERNDRAALLSEHDNLLGSALTPGQLPGKLKFSYGANADGTQRNAPNSLSSPRS